MHLLEKHKHEIVRLCQKHKVARLYAFGSVIRDDFSISSDVDLVVSFADAELALYADNYYDFKFSLERLFERNVDLLEEQAIRNSRLRAEIDRTKVAVYG